MTSPLLALECPVEACRWRPALDTTLGVVAAHMETEHPDLPTRGDGSGVLILVVVCRRDNERMTHVGSLGLIDHYECPRCRRCTTVRCTDPDAPVI